MICLPDAIRLMRDPQSAPCEPCVVAAMRSPITEAMNRVAVAFKAEREAEPGLDPLDIVSFRRAANFKNEQDRKANRLAKMKQWRARRSGT